jgi:hypothetical protein
MTGSERHVPSSLRAPGNRIGGEQDEQPVRVAHGRYAYRSVRCRLSDAPRRASQAESGEPAQRRLDVDEERQQEEPVLGGEGRGPAGTSPSKTLSSRTPAWSSGTRASPRKTARRPRLGALSRSGQSLDLPVGYACIPSRWSPTVISSPPDGYLTGALVEVRTARHELSLPPKLTYGELKGFTLYATRTVLSGGGEELIELAQTNLRELDVE